MRAICITLAAVAVSVALAVPLQADENAWLLTGRVKEIHIENGPQDTRRVRVFVNVQKDPPGAAFTVVDTICKPEFEPTCENLNFMLGSCSKEHLIAPMVDIFLGGFLIDIWRCANPHAARCQSMSGVNLPERRLDAVTQGGGCQF